MALARSRPGDDAPAKPTKEGIAEILTTSHTVRHLVALVATLDGTATAGEVPLRKQADLRFHPRETRAATGWWNHVPEVVHPQQRYAKARTAALSPRKVKSGADSAITQFFFNPDTYFQLHRRRVARWQFEVPIVPGADSHNYAKIHLTAAATASRFHAGSRCKMEGFMDDSRSVPSSLNMVSRAWRSG